mmetsp:Transcript_33074/g.78344  ORF Transcript_33074/g.78344 Transcript_33074/m.78344 type:complete len:274 (-) Transcript_33074:5263-6084(-)
MSTGCVQLSTTILSALPSASFGVMTSAGADGSPRIVDATALVITALGPATVLTNARTQIGTPGVPAANLTPSCSQHSVHPPTQHAFETVCHTDDADGVANVYWIAKLLYTVSAPAAHVAVSSRLADGSMTRSTTLGGTSWKRTAEHEVLPCRQNRTTPRPVFGQPLFPERSTSWRWDTVPEKLVQEEEEVSGSTMYGPEYPSANSKTTTDDVPFFCEALRNDSSAAPARFRIGVAAASIILAVTEQSPSHVLISTLLVYTPGVAVPAIVMLAS